MLKKILVSCVIGIQMAIASAGTAPVPMFRANNTVFATSYVMQVCPILMGSRPATVYINEMANYGRIMSPEAWAFIRTCDAVGGARARML